MEQINANNSRYAGSTRVAEDLGYMPAPVREYSEDGETPVHLDGLQAVGYARIRKLDSDFMRTSRQRRVVQAALTALRGRLYDPGMYVRVAKVLFGTMETNMNAVRDKYASPGHESAGLRADRADAPARGRHV